MTTKTTRTYFDTEQPNRKKMNLTLRYRKIKTSDGWETNWFSYVKDIISLTKSMMSPKCLN